MRRETHVTWIALGVLTCFAAALRVAYAHELDLTYAIRNDAADYASYGWNLAQHGVFSRSVEGLSGGAPPADSFRSPGLPLLVAVALKVWERSSFLRPFLYVQALIGASAVPFTFLLGRRWLTAKGALVAAALTALSPHLVTLGGYLLTEVLFGVSLLAFALAFLTAIERRSFAWAAAAGLLAGWTYLVNEVALVLVLGLTALHAALAWRRTSGAERARLLRCMTIVTLLFAAFPVGWSVREAVSVGDPALRGSARAVQTMSHGAYPDFIHRNPAFREYPYLDDPEQPEFGSSFGAFSRILAKRVAERPLRYASWYLFEKPYWLWSWRILQGDPNEDIYVYPVERSLYRQFAPAEWSCILMQLLHLPLVVLAFYAAFLCVRGVRGSASFDAALALPLLPAAVLILVTVLYTVFACWSRYAVPFRPVLYVAAVWGAAELVQRLRARA